MQSKRRELSERQMVLIALRRVDATRRREERTFLAYSEAAEAHRQAVNLHREVYQSWHYGQHGGTFGSVSASDFTLKSLAQTKMAPVTK